MLLAARFLQGIGGAVSSAVILGMVVSMFPEPAERARAIGIFSFVASAGASIGLLAGGIITQAVSWHWIFFVNLPIGVVVAVLASRMLEADRGIGLNQGGHSLGALLVTAGLMLGVLAIMRFGARNVLLAGFGLIIVALVLAALGPVSADYLRDWFPVLALPGIGGGLAFPSLGVVAMAGATPSDAGLASGLLNTTGQVGAALGLAVLATVATNRTSELTAQGQSVVAALSSGYHLAWAIGAALAIASILVAATVLRREAAASESVPDDEVAETCA